MNLFSAQLIVSLIFLVLFIKLQWVITRTEAQLKQEKLRALYVDSSLASLESLAKQKEVSKHVDTSSHTVQLITKKLAIKSVNKALVVDSSIKSYIPDTVFKPALTQHFPKLDSVKRIFTFYAGYEEAIRINKLLSITKVDLMLAMSSYDSLYQYTRFLGLTNWKLSFVQKREGRSDETVAQFRISKGKIMNNQLVSCQFVEELPDNVFNQAARIVTFNGNIINAGISGELSWIDRSDGGMVPVKIPVQLTRKN